MPIDQQSLERVLAWARYLYWCDLIRQQWDAYMVQHGASPELPEWLAHTSYWYGSLYVVVEGWEHNRFEDDVIHSLLSRAAGFKDLLRRYRNTIFHYQTSLADSRMLDFMSSGEEHLLWTITLHEEFCRWFRAWVNEFPVDGPLKDDFIEAVRAVVGFVPESSLGRKGDGMRRLIEVANASMAETPDIPAVELREAVLQSESILNQVMRAAERNRLDRLFRVCGFTPESR